jgi:uncharacterized membrane protein
MYIYYIYNYIYIFRTFFDRLQRMFNETKQFLVQLRVMHSVQSALQQLVVRGERISRWLYKENNKLQD